MRRESERLVLRLCLFLLLLLLHGEGFRVQSTSQCYARLLARLNSEEIEKYRRIQQLIKFKELNGSGRNGTFNGRPIKGSHRSFEKRLKAWVGLKADVWKDFRPEESIDELEQFMNDDSREIDVPVDDEELLYEKIVLEIMEEETSREVEESLALQREMLNSLEDPKSSESNRDFNNTGLKEESTTNTDDLYTPKVSTWGIFPRPKNISPVFGGGRVIDAKAVDRELEASAAEAEVSPRISPFQRESSHRKEVEKALKQARVHLLNGSAVQAILSLEKIREYLLWETEFSGEVWLELAMAYEMVYRLDEARSIYNKILQQNGSQKNRRNASLLLSGLDIAKKVSKKLAEGQQDTIEAFNSFSSSDAFNEVMDRAVYSSWDSYKRKSSRYSSDALLDKEIAKRLASYNYTRIEECYHAFLAELQPLSSIDKGILLRATRGLAAASVEEKLRFISSRDSRHPEERLNSPLKSLIASLKTRNSLDDQIRSASQPPVSQDFSAFVNGSGEVVSSFSSGAAQRKRFELGENRRVIDIAEQRCRESFPSFFGLSTSSCEYSCHFDSLSSQLQFAGDQLRRSASPWLRPRLSLQRVEVIYCDDSFMLTRQRFPDERSGDLICLWRRLAPSLYRKYQ